MKAGKRLRKLNSQVQLDNSLPCLPCAAEDHLLCLFPDLLNVKCCCSDNQPEPEFSGLISPGNKRRGKEPVDITDVQSTGRKRAAIMYPIEDGMICEWSKLKYAGGGVFPVIGCLGNLATDRHHGPDKNTLNNNENNVHRICATDHNRWHELNDRFYGERPSGTEPFIPLDGHKWRAHDKETKAEIKEVIEYEVAWKSKGKGKMVDFIMERENTSKILEQSGDTPT